MKVKSFIPVLALSLLTQAAARPQETPLPVTPALKQQIAKYAKQVSKRACGSRYEAYYVTPAPPMSPADFNSFYNNMLQMSQLSVAQKKNGSTAVGKVRSGESGYIYINNMGAGADDMVFILSRQSIGGAVRVVVQGCVLN